MKRPPEDGSLYATLAARVLGVIRERRWKKSMFAHGRVSANTVRRVLHGKNCRLSTLIELAEALDCDLVIDLHPRTIVDTSQVIPPHIAHEKT